jgi:predicted nucleic acid-binding protein
MTAVSNSSVLIALSSIGLLELIHQRFPDGVIIPQAVWREVVETGAGRVGSEQVAKAS